MTQEDKELLLKDLCAKFPYGIKFPYHIEEDSNHRECNCIATINSISEDTIEFSYNEGNIERNWTCAIFEVKPYLRPMSSMTDAEEEEYDSLNVYELGSFPHTEEAFDWLNAHHFDYRYLIRRNLAIEALEGMYCTKED